MVRKPSYVIVIKLGTSSIVHEKTHQPLLSLLSSLVETVIHLRSEGHKVVLVSSGAIGVGLKRMEIPSRPKGLAAKQVSRYPAHLTRVEALPDIKRGSQALAAIGQGRLIALWDNLFSQLGQPIAQVLLTRGDLSDVSSSPQNVHTTLADATIENPVFECCKHFQGTTVHGCGADCQRERYRVCQRR
jgi:glutamate 5-kinase